LAFINEEPKFAGSHLDFFEGFNAGYLIQTAQILESLKL